MTLFHKFFDTKNGIEKTMLDDEDFPIPTTLEIIMSGLIILSSFIMSSFLFWIMKISDDFSWLVETAIFITMFFVFLIGLQSIFNCFYVRWQRKDDWQG